MSTANQVIEHIKQTPANKPFAAASLRHLGTADNVRQILNRLALSKKIVRVSRGIFIKPKTPTASVTTSIQMSPKEIAKNIAEITGEKLAIHGAEAARLLRLSTQMPLQPSLYTTGRTRKMNINNRIVRLQHVSQKKLTAAGTAAGLAISALWYLGKEHVTLKTIEHVAKQLGTKEFNSIFNHVEYMPAWMANVFYQYKNKTARSG